MAGQDATDGTPFGRYRLVEMLGRGGMGEVWRAHDTATNRIVAIKLLPPHLAQDDAFVQRFRREAEAAAQVNNPHVIPIHDYGEIDGRLYVNMRLVEGRDLHEVLTEGAIEPARAVRIIEQVAKALHAAHKVGLVHRDVKPSNILLDEDDFAYLIDFGLARTTDGTRMTGTGNIIGSWPYMSPERLRDGQVDARADIYALACVLYECLTGSAPFPGDSFEQQITAHLHSPPPRPSSTQPEVPAAVDEVIATGMAKDPDQRYATTVELAGAARDAITEPIQRPAANPTRIRETQPAHNGVTDQPATLKAGSPPPAKPAPSRPARSTPTKGGGVSRRTTLTLIGGGAIAAIAAGVGIPALTKNQPSQSSTRTYGAQIMLPFTGINNPWAVAVDSTGNLYVADYNRVLKMPVGSSSQEVLPFTGLTHIDGIAVDTAGNVYIADNTGYNVVLKLAAGATTPTELPFTGRTPSGVAVDSASNVYITTFDNAPLKLAAGATTPTELPFTGLRYPRGVAVDSTGNLYVADTGNNRVLKLAAGATTPTELPFTGLRIPWGVAVESNGALYVADHDNKQVLKLAPGSPTQTVLPFTGLNEPFGVAVDSAGNVYLSDGENPGRVLKLPVQ